jgi:hypothetical protein
MKKFLLLIILLFPVITFAGTHEVDMWNDFEVLTQLKEKQEIWQDGMYAKYEANPKMLTDKITYKVNWKTWTTKWPWSLATQKMRKKVRECIEKNNLTPSGCGWYDYKIVRISPSGNYIELIWDGWGIDIWRMLDTRSGKLIFSNDNGVTKSMWTRDRKQFIWKTGTCEIGWCSDPQWTFITELGKFPKYKKVK